MPDRYSLSSHSCFSVCAPLRSPVSTPNSFLVHAPASSLALLTFKNIWDHSDPHSRCPGNSPAKSFHLCLNRRLPTNMHRHSYHDQGSGIDRRRSVHVAGREESPQDRRRRRRRMTRAALQRISSLDSHFRRLSLVRSAVLSRRQSLPSIDGSNIHAPNSLTQAHAHIIVAACSPPFFRHDDLSLLLLYYNFFLPPSLSYQR